MRKSCLAAVILLSCMISVSAFAESPLSLRFLGTGQFAGNYATFPSGTTNNASVGAGFAIGMEGLYKVLPYLELGVGLQYQFARQATFQGTSIGNFEFVPIYAVVRVPVELGPVEPYLVGRIGYGFLSGDSTFTGSGLITLNGGLYFAAGGGIDYHLGSAFSIFAEAAYALDDGSETVSVLSTTTNTAYTGLNVSVGISISL